VFGEDYLRENARIGKTHNQSMPYIFLQEKIGKVSCRAQHVKENGYNNQNFH